jgi:hypothetical protein
MRYRKIFLSLVGAIGCKSVHFVSAIKELRKNIGVQYYISASYRIGAQRCAYRYKRQSVQCSAVQWSPQAISVA